MEKKTIIPLRWFIGFLCVMAALTFISRQVYASKLPVVSAESFTQQNIIHTVKAAGSVQYDSVQPVFLPQGAVIDKVCVHSGDKVEKGDVLAQLNIQSLKRSADELEAQIQELQSGSSAFETCEDSPVFTESGLRVQKLNVSVGDEVHKGDVLMTADNEHLLKYINSLEAERNKDMISRNGACKSKNAPISTDAQDFSGEDPQDRIDTLNISITEQQKLIDRYTKIYYSGGDILADTDGIVTKLNIGAGDITTESAVMVISGSSTPSGSLAAKQVQLESLKALLADDGSVYSPAAGTVSKVNAEAGTPAADTASFFITDTTGGKLYFTADIDEDSAKRLSVGDKVTITFRNGKLSYENAHISAMTKTDSGYRAEIPLDPEGFPQAYELENSEIGEVSAAASSAQAYQCINKEAVYGSGNERYIFVLREYDGFFGKEYRAVRQNVTVDDENSDIAGTLSSGLTQEDKVIVITDKPLTDSVRVRLSAESQQHSA